jgi:hypothetical protein
MKRALLIGKEPEAALGFEYVREGAFDAVVIGSLTLGQLVCFREERALQALAQGKSVVLYTPGLPEVKNRALGASLAAKQRELKSWGIVFTDGCKRHLVTAQEAKALRQRGLRPEAGAVLTPLAKEILEGTE